MKYTIDFNNLINNICNKSDFYYNKTYDFCNLCNKSNKLFAKSICKTHKICITCISTINNIPEINDLCTYCINLIDKIRPNTQCKTCNTNDKSVKLDHLNHIVCNKCYEKSKFCMHCNTKLNKYIFGYHEYKISYSRNSHSEYLASNYTSSDLHEIIDRIKFYGKHTNFFDSYLLEKIMKNYYNHILLSIYYLDFNLDNFITFINDLHELTEIYRLRNNENYRDYHYNIKFIKRFNDKYDVIFKKYYYLNYLNSFMNFKNTNDDNDNYGYFNRKQNIIFECIIKYIYKLKFVLNINYNMQNNYFFYKLIN